MTLSGDEGEAEEGGGRKGLAGGEDEEGLNNDQIGSVATSGIPARPAGGMPRRRKLSRKEKRIEQKTETEKQR